MENLYLGIVILLFVLAIFDLVVGVSNDAVNFLNSALGSKVASYNTIIIIASLGILIGAVSSGGMMEVARKGIFNPEHFFFNEIIVLFLAVMITDILLLDLFNTLAMPTSTTVSIVFEILGAALALSIIKTISNNESINYIFNVNDPEKGIIGYMNWSKASEIIIGILSSVVIAFTIGAIVQYFARLIFSFNYKSRLKWVGTIWSALAFTAITYFLLFKGLASVVKDIEIVDMNFFQLFYYHIHEWVVANILEFLLYSFLGYTVLMFILGRFKNINLLKLVVLFGTFSLAMAFAGNDLVNFIGVPIAGWQSYMIWNGTGIAPELFPMDALQGKVATPFYLLLLAGIIMIITLWKSKKAKAVTETEINLGAQSETEERFHANYFARAIVNGGTYLNKGINKLIPTPILMGISKNFSSSETADTIESEEGAPAFDLVRASVNLVVASVLIAIATDLKLPLSTTYVSFMVAMGTSLSDRAWGRESAVYRVAGVMNVIGGWFATALIASSVAAVFATFMFYGGVYAIGLLVLLIGFSLYHSSKHHLKSLDKKKRLEEKTKINYKDVGETLGLLSNNLTDSFNKIDGILHLVVSGIENENRKKLEQAEYQMNLLNEDYAMVKSGLYKIIKGNKSQETTSSHLYVLTYDLMQDLLQSLDLIVENANRHVLNNHKPLRKEQIDRLRLITNSFSDYLAYIKESFEGRQFHTIEEVNVRNNNIQKEVEDVLSQQIAGVMNKEYGFKNTSLYFTILLEIKDLSAISARFMKLYSRITHEGRLTK